MGDIIMKRCYVGVGGIGCRLLKEYEKAKNGQDKFIYIGAVPDDLQCLDEKTGECYALVAKGSIFKFIKLFRESGVRCFFWEDVVTLG